MNLDEACRIVRSRKYQTWIRAVDRAMVGLEAEGRDTVKALRRMRDYCGNLRRNEQGRRDFMAAHGYTSPTPAQARAARRRELHEMKTHE